MCLDRNLAVLAILVLGGCAGTVLAPSRPAGVLATASLARGAGAPARGTGRGASLTPVVCAGPHDLIIDRGAVPLTGNQAFDRLCIQDGGRLIVTSTLTLRVGLLYVAADGAVVADGADGYEYDTHDCISNSVQPDGRSGGVLTIIARHAIIHGRISANGGAGLSSGPACDWRGTPSCLEDIY